MNKIGFLSCEFVTDKNSYWLTSGCGKLNFCFVEIPNDVIRFFNQNESLNFQCLNQNKDYSEITAFEENGNKKYIFALSQNNFEDTRELSIDLDNFNTLSWKQMAALVQDNFTLDELSGFYQNHIVRKTKESEYKINNVDYKVTAFLPEEGIFSIMGNDYKIPENPNWITFSDNVDKESFLAVLDNFEIFAISMNGKYYLV